MAYERMFLAVKLFFGCSGTHLINLIYAGLFQPKYGHFGLILTSGWFCLCFTQPCVETTQFIL